MTTPRKDLIDLDVTRWYHCISRCVRSALLLGKSGNKTDRKQWIENRLEKLNKNFAISVGGFAVMDNHLHVLVRLDPEEAEQWSAREVAERYLDMYPPRNMALHDEKVVEAWINNLVNDPGSIEKYRERLGNLSWFMKSLKEPLARLANKEDGCKGCFWDQRFKSPGVVGDEALLATCAYIDLNPIAAGTAETPESSAHTSVRQRVQHVRRQNKLGRLKAARKGSVAGSRAAGNIEQNHWLVPIEDRSNHPNKRKRGRVGMLETFSLGSYLLLVDYTGRLFRQGKARMNTAVQEIFERLESSCEYWSEFLTKMRKRGGPRGTKISMKPIAQ